MKNVVILGSTGSIGQNALRVVETLSDQLRVIGLSADKNTSLLLQQAARHNVRNVAVSDMASADDCVKSSPEGIRVFKGNDGLIELAKLPDADIVLCAVVGMAGLAPVLASLSNGIDVALATKEVLVSAGSLVVRAAADNRAQILPVDSEHSAVFQCLDGKPPKDVKRILLTASGGPFAQNPNVDFDKVTVAEALDHPRWNMGKKVTVDSATLMNKGLEIMEAHWLFGLPFSVIDVVVHPQSIVHSVVEFVDGSMLAQMSQPDMRFAIQHALTYPQRMNGNLPQLDLTEVGTLHFEQPDSGRFPCLAMARTAGDTGGTMPAVLNAANEIAVENFLEGTIPFSGIWHTIENVMKQHDVVAEPGLEEIISADRWARKVAGAA